MSEKFHDHYVEMCNSRWLVSELDFSNMDEEWEHLSKSMKILIKAQLAFLSQFDNLVAMQCDFFKARTKSYAKEIGYFYIEQASNELIHSRVYSLLVQGIFHDPNISSKLLNAIEHVPVIGEMADWVYKYMSDSSEEGKKRWLLNAVVVFCCLEGVIFSFSFCAIFLLKHTHPGLLAAVTKSNEWIARDENKHRIFGTDVFKHVLEIELEAGTVDAEEIRSDTLRLVNKANSLVRSFIDHCFSEMSSELGRPVTAIHGASKKDFEQYLDFICSDLISYLGYEPAEQYDNPFIWMLTLSIPQKSNIHEVKGATEYSGYSETVDLSGALSMDTVPDF